ncbi:hypothetical protein, partial [Caldilinea sp.]|uniref:hypothetical protein n=1 Tax=Caldilinea sp. TaxID=2293560 RepID=UPI002B5D60A3|nr:hypothetical protein [Caldilinea sp.]
QVRVGTHCSLSCSSNLNWRCLHLTVAKFRIAGILGVVLPEATAVLQLIHDEARCWRAWV